MASMQWRPRNPEQPVARTSAVWVELGTIVEIQLTPRRNPGHDPGMTWPLCLPEPIVIGGWLHTSNRFPRNVLSWRVFGHPVWQTGATDRSANRLCSRPKRQAEAKLNRLRSWCSRPGSTRAGPGLGRSDRLWYKRRPPRPVETFRFAPPLGPAARNAVQTIGHSRAFSHRA